MLDTKLDYEKITFDRIPQVLETKVNLSEYMNIETDYIHEKVMNDAILRINMELFGQAIKQEYEVRVDIPKDIWQHLKGKYAPKWFSKRFPVKTTAIYKKVEFNHHEIYPVAKMGNGAKRYVFSQGGNGAYDFQAERRDLKSEIYQHLQQHHMNEGRYNENFHELDIHWIVRGFLEYLKKA